MFSLKPIERVSTVHHHLLLFLSFTHRHCLKLKMNRMFVLRLVLKQNKLLSLQNLMKEFLSVKMALEKLVSTRRKKIKFYHASVLCEEL